MVTFSIGGITLGTVYGAKVITPVQLTESESPADAAALNQLVFLQSLDLNSDSDDGIQISEQAHNLAENLKLDFDSRMFSEEAAILVAQLSGGANGLVSEEDALTHFYETYDELGGAIVFGFEFSEPLTGNTDTDSEQNSDDSSTDNSGDEAGDNSQNNSGNNSGDSTDYNSDDYNDGSSGEGSGGEEGGSGDGSGGNSENGSGDSSNTGTVAVTVLVQAEDYVDYYDIDPGNNGNGYRTEDVDIESTTDIDGGFNVGWTAIGEWLDYNVELEAGVYAVSTRVASQVSSGSYSLLLNNASFASDSVMSTGGWQNFVTHTVGSLEVVSSGTHVLRLLVTGNEFNINWIKFTPINDADGDGVGDASDQCPTTPEGLDVDLLGCEIIPVEQEVSYANERLIGGLDSAFPGFTLYVFDNDQSLSLIHI